MSSAVSGRPRRGFGVVVGLVVRGVREAERELLPGRRDGGRRNDAGAKMISCSLYSSRDAGLPR